MTNVPFETVSKHRCFGGTVGFYKHQASATACTMKFSVFTPPQAERGKVPVLYYLAGLTCTEETFVTKACALEHAARLGIMLVAPDTSPRINYPATATAGTSASRPVSISTRPRRRGRVTTACTATW